MKLGISTGKEFVPHPEGVGIRAVCVDCTPVEEKRYPDPNDPENPDADKVVKGFHIVFETEKQMDNGEPFCVRSKYLGLKYTENSNLKKLLDPWWGRSLSAREADDLDDEHLIGKSAILSVIHSESKGKVYANIASIRPDSTSNPLRPSGHYTRVKDRPKSDAPSYRHAEQPSDLDDKEEPLKVHVGNFRGLAFSDLSPEEIEKLMSTWLPKAKANPRPSADDKRLIAALQEYQDKQDGVPF